MRFRRTFATVFAHSIFLKNSLNKRIFFCIYFISILYLLLLKKCSSDYPRIKSRMENLINLLPSDKAIKSIELIENINDFSPNFLPISKTWEDLDADIFKENILFGKRNTRYLCISKTGGFESHVVEQIKIISASENLAREGFLSIKKTSDTNQKAWRKKQLVYKLSKVESCTEFVTDIVILSKYRPPGPEGFRYLGELEKVHICYKTSSLSNPQTESEIIDFTKQIENLKMQSNLYPMVNGDHYYESLKLSYQLPKPVPARQAPLPPTAAANTGTLSHYHHDFIGIPFVLHPKIMQGATNHSEGIPTCSSEASTKLEYDFMLERQILCATKAENRKSTSTNPFF
jgi:ESCRT-I complex subunit MVB12